MRALHAIDRAGRRHTRGPLVVGASRAPGVRPAPPAARCGGAQRDRGSFGMTDIDAALLERPLEVDSTADLRTADTDHLGWLESEAIHILREVAGQCRNPVLLFSGGKDSLVLLRLAEKAFRPGPFPFPLLHIDTGHNFPEVIAFRDHRAAELGERLIVRSVEDSIAKGRVVLRDVTESRNR